MAFLFVKSGRVNFVSVKFLKSKQFRHLLPELRSVIEMYGRRGMTVISVNGDGEFDSNKVRDFVQPAILHICAPEKHVGIAERGIRTVKERARTMVHSLEFRRYPRVMVKSLVEYMGFLLNRIPSENGVSRDDSPAEIVLGINKMDIGTKYIPWGAYAQAWTTTKNTMVERSVHAIAMHPANENGNVYFMNLENGEKFSSNKWKEIPITDDVIDRVHEIALEQDQPEVIDHELIFEWQPGVPIENIDANNNENDDNNNDDGGDNNDDAPADDEHNADAADEEEQEDAPVNNDMAQVTDDDTDSNEQEGSDIEEQMSNDEDEDQDTDDNEVDRHVQWHGIDENNNMLGEDANEDNEDDDDDETILYDENEDVIDTTIGQAEDNDGDEHLGFQEGPDGVRRSSRKQQSNKNPYGGKGGSLNMQSRYQDAAKKVMKDENTEIKHKKAMQFFVTEQHEKQRDKNQTWMNIAVKKINMIFTQMHASKGIKEFGMRAVAAILKELTQLDVGAVPGKNQRVCVPIDPSTLTSEELKQALDAVNLIKLKRGAR